MVLSKAYGCRIGCRQYGLQRCVVMRPRSGAGEWRHAGDGTMTPSGDDVPGSGQPACLTSQSVSLSPDAPGHQSAKPDVTEHVKHAMFAHFSIVVASIAFIIAAITETQTIRTKAQEELTRLRLAIDGWSRRDKWQLRDTVLAEIRSSSEYAATVAGLDGRESPGSLASLLQQTTTEDQSPKSEDFARGFMERIKNHVVLKVPAKVLDRDVHLHLVVDPISCIAGGRQAQVLGDLESFWSDLVTENKCYLMQGLRSNVEFREIPPGYEFPVFGALAGEDLLVVANAGQVLDVVAEKADPHRGRGPVHPMEVWTVLFGARGKSTAPYKTNLARLFTTVRVELREINASPLLRHFDGQRWWIHAPFAKNFPALAEVTRNYPRGISLADLDEVIRLEARRDEDDFQSFGLRIPRSALTALGMPLILGVVLYFLVTLRELSSRLEATYVSVRPAIPWIGIYGGLMPKTLAALSAIGLPVAAEFAGLVSALGRHESHWAVGIASVCLAGTAIAAVYLVRVHGRINKAWTSPQREAA